MIHRLSTPRVSQVFSFLLFLLTLFPLTAAAADRTSYTLGVPTQLSPVAMHSSWAPFVERLSKEMGATITLKVYDTVSRYEEDVLRGVPDFVFLNPYLAVKTRKTHGYIPLIRDKSLLAGVLVVPKNSALQSIQDLNAKKIAFPTPNAFAASLYMRALLKEREKIDFIPCYVMSHSNVYRNVLLGKTAAGGGVNKSLDKERQEVKAQLRVIYTTPGQAPHPLSAHPRVPKELRQAVIDTIIRLAGDPANRDMLNKIQIPEPVKADYTRDYLPLERLRLGKYFVSGGK